MLDEPALMTRMTSMSLPQDVSNDGGRRLLAPRERDQRRNGAGSQPRDDGIRAAREDDGHFRAEHDAGGIGAREKRQAFREHVARFEIGHDEHVRMARYGRLDALDLRGFFVDCVVERKRTVEYAALDLAAVGHLA